MTAPDLARRLVEHPRWTWQPGMYAVDPATLMGVFVVIDSMVSNEELHAHRLPSINHPATKGWLLHMLREATGNHHCHARKAFTVAGWCVIGAGPYRKGALNGEFWPTEGEALAAALLAVWGAS